MGKIKLGLFGLALAAIGAAKTWLHLQGGGVLTLEGCQGGVFAIPLEASSAHCWGCYAMAIGLALLIGSQLGDRVSARAAAIAYRRKR